MEHSLPCQSFKTSPKMRCSTCWKKKVFLLTKHSHFTILPAMKLLNSGNAKTRKGEKFGWKTFGIHLAPANQSGFNVCKWATKGCAAACLNTAGRGAMSSVQTARVNKTKFFFQDKRGFLSQLVKEIKAAIKHCGKRNLNSCFRLNLTSDLPWEKIRFDGKTVFELFPDVKFYDYTKSQDRMIDYLQGRMPANYQLTFSRSEETPDALSRAILASGGNVAVVFRGKLPETFLGFPVVDGDESDLRFLDGRGVVVGLVEKGLAKKDESGFVVG